MLLKYKFINVRAIVTYTYIETANTPPGGRDSSFKIPRHRIIRQNFTHVCSDTWRKLCHQLFQLSSYIRFCEGRTYIIDIWLLMNSRDLNVDRLKQCQVHFRKYSSIRAQACESDASEKRGHRHLVTKQSMTKHFRFCLHILGKHTTCSCWHQNCAWIPRLDLDSQRLDLDSSV